MHPAVTAVASAAAVLLLQKALKRRKYGANKEYKKVCHCATSVHPSRFAIAR